MSAMSGQNIQIKFMGQRLAVKSQDDPELVKQVVDLVTLKLNSAESRARGVGPAQVAILAMLELAEDYLKAKQRVEEYQTEIQSKLDAISEVIKST